MMAYDIVCVVTNDITYDRRMIRTCDTLAKEGKKVLIIGREIPGRSYHDNFLFDTYRLICEKNSGPLFYKEILDRAHRHLKRISYTDLLLTDYDTILLARLQRGKARRIYLDLHEYFEHTPELSGNQIKKSIWKMAAQIGQAKCDVIYTVNDSLAGFYSERFNRDVKVIFNVPEKKTLAEGNETSVETDIINTVYLGALNPGRGLEEIIQAIQQAEGFHLTIIGDGPLLKSLQDMVDDPSKVHFTGMAKPEELPSLLTGKDFGWNLLEVNSKSYYYSLANKFFDYIHHGVPVVTMDFPEYSRILFEHSCGKTLSELSVPAVSDLLQFVSRDREHLRKWKEACPQVAAKYNWELESEKLIELFS